MPKNGIKVPLIIYGLCAVLWTISNKLIGQETFRPFHYISTSILAVTLGSCLFLDDFNLKKTLKGVFQGHKSIYIFSLCYILILVLSAFSEMRMVKNSIWSISIDGLCFLATFLFLEASNQSLQKSLLIYLKFMAALSIAMSAIANLQFLDFTNVIIGEYSLAPSPNFTNRLHGLLGEPTSMGALTSIGLICLIGIYLLEPDRFQKKISLLMIPFLGSAIILSSSKNSLLAMIIALAILFVSKLKNVKIILPFALASLTLYFSWEIVAPMLRINTDFESYSTRISAWKNGTKALYNSPTSSWLKGIGAGFFESNFGGSFNSFLRLGVDFGILIPILWLTAILWLVRKPIRSSENLSMRVNAVLIVYTLVFSFFQDIFLREFFNVVNFNFVVMSSMLIWYNVKGSSPQTINSNQFSA